MGKTGIIIQREFNVRVRKRSFIITTVLTPLLFIGLMAAMVAVTSRSGSDTKHILVRDNSGIVAQNLKNTKNISFEPTDKTPEEIKVEKKKGVYGILVVGDDIMDNPRNVQLYTYGAPTVDLESTISKRVSDIVEAEKLKEKDIEDLPGILEDVKTNVSVQAFRMDDQGQSKESSSVLSMTLAYLFGLIIYMFVFIYGGMVMQGVIEEKSSKVLEVMVSSASPFQLMMGKIIGIAAVAVTQFFIWIALVVIGSTLVMSFAAGDTVMEAATAMNQTPAVGAAVPGMGDMNPQAAAAIAQITDLKYIASILGTFLVYFIGGYLLYAAMFAAIGSAVDNPADAQQLQLPITIPMVLALVIMMNVMREPHSTMATVFSMIPFTSPIIMVARMPYGVPGWEVALSITILCLSFIAMVWLAAKIYRVGIFMYGKKPSLKEIVKWAGYKY